uniref:Annexin n=1 Tax=Elaeophora elaphi TaxID=1147741 RepID=A0A0R3RKF7_9BILA
MGDNIRLNKFEDEDVNSNFLNPMTFCRKLRKFISNLLKLCLKMSERFYGTIKPRNDFNAEEAADTLYNAMQGSGCDKYRVIQVIAHCNNAQRQMIRSPYKNKYGKDLVEELKKELSGDLEDVIIGLMETPTKYDAMQLQKAMKVVGVMRIS